MTFLTLVNPEYVRLVGPTAGILLSKIDYWFSPDKNGVLRVRIVRDDKYWIAKSRMEWQEECGLSLKQYNTSIKKLKDLGVVKTEVHLFKNKTVPFIWLDKQKLIELVEQKRSKEVSKKLDACSQKGTTGCAHMVTTTCAQIGTTLLTSITPKITAHPQAYAGGDMKIKEMLGSRKEKEGVVNVKPTTSKMVALYKLRVSTLYGEFVKEPTIVEKKQFKMMMEKIGDDSLRVLDYCLCNWSKYVWRVKVDKGLGNTPLRPHIGFMLKYHDVAVNLFINAKGKNKPEQQNEVLQLIASSDEGIVRASKVIVKPEVKPEVEEEKMPTYEETMALLYDGKQCKTQFK